MDTTILTQEKEMNEEKNYDVAVSYASEQRSYVERFVKRLQSHKMSIYYDRDAQAQMVGMILDQKLHKIYIQESKHCVLFLSHEYIKKPVTRYESSIILSESLYEENFMYIFKFDNVTLPGLNRNFVYSSLGDYPEPEQYADFIYEVISGKKPTESSSLDLFKIITDGLRQIVNQYAYQYDWTLQIDEQANKTLLRLHSGLSTRLQLQTGQLPGKDGVCLWLHRGCQACDDHAYQGYVEWSSKNHRYYMENCGVLSNLTPQLEFASTIELLDSLKSEIEVLIGG